MGERKNVIWIFGDQHRAQAMSVNGDPNVHTPQMDILAATGVHFNKAVSGFPLCCPYRGSLLTGRYPHHCVPGHQYALPDHDQTIARVFIEHGYQTAYFGKWHLDGFQESKGRAAHQIVPPARRGGFEQWIGYENNNSPWDCWVHGGEGDDAFHHRLPGFETDALTDYLIQYIKDRGKEKQSGAEMPFFTVLSVQPPHNPYAAPAEFMERFNPASIQLRPNVPNIRFVTERARRELAGYYAMIENLDRNIGRIREALAQTDLAQDTHILFFSDHGDMHGSHGMFYKANPYEESIRVPFIISGEQPYYEGRKSGIHAAPLNHVDVAPTTLGLCGIAAPEWMEGTDYSHCRIDKRPGGPEPDSAFLQSVMPPGENGRIQGYCTDRPWRGLVTKDGWKYVCLEGVPWLMFNLNDDPYEQMNLAHNQIYAHERKRLNERLRAWIHDTKDEFKLPSV